MEEGAELWKEKKKEEEEEEEGRGVFAKVGNSLTLA